MAKSLAHRNSKRAPQGVYRKVNQEIALLRQQLQTEATDKKRLEKELKTVKAQLTNTVKDLKRAKITNVQFRKIIQKHINTYNTKTKTTKKLIVPNVTSTGFGIKAVHRTREQYLLQDAPRFFAQFFTRLKVAYGNNWNDSWNSEIQEFIMSKVPPLLWGSFISVVKLDKMFFESSDYTDTPKYDAMDVYLYLTGRG